MSTSLNVCNSLKSMKAELTTIGRAFYSVMSLIFALVVMVKFGFSVPKMQPT